MSIRDSIRRAAASQEAPQQAKQGSLALKIQHASERVALLQKSIWQLEKMLHASTLSAAAAPPHPEASDAEKLRYFDEVIAEHERYIASLEAIATSRRSAA